VSHKKNPENRRQAVQPRSNPDHALCRQGELKSGIDGYSGGPPRGARSTQAHERDLKPRDYATAVMFGICTIVATYLASTLIAQQKVALIDLLH